MDSQPVEGDFLTELNAIVEKNMANEQFGVTELASAMNMSRSNLLRKVKKETKLSVTQLISQARLKKAMDLLRKSSHNVSEVSHQVGFNSTSYFIKCFREYYGYPPGEVGKRAIVETVQQVTPSRSRRKIMLATTLGVLAVAAGSFFSWPSPDPPLEKSIAVLPFKNDSDDSTNLYLINGLMESTLTNLQKIKGLKVISRTSSEKYRHTSKSIPELAKELNVNYFVEGSGQKIGDKILLNIQLIEGPTDRHLWGNQYRRETRDIFELQQEIARNIAEEVKVIVTPDAERKISRRPTTDPVAYDHFLKGKDLFYKGSAENLLASLPWFKKAIEKDNKFAAAYANAAMVYYYLDAFQVQKKYESEQAAYADKALLLDPALDESLIAKALYFMNRYDYASALPYFEKALEYNPESGLVFHFLLDLYNIHTPDSRKYLEYALKKVRADAGGDSLTMSYDYMHLANAFVQNGFVDDALVYADKSLAFCDDIPFTGLVRTYVLYARNRDSNQIKDLLINELKKDTTRGYLTQDIARCYYYLRDYEAAHRYNEKFIAFRDASKMNLYPHADLEIAMVKAKRGDKTGAAKYFSAYKAMADTDSSIYRDFNLAMYYAATGDQRKATNHLKLFSKQDHFQYRVLFLMDDPIVDPLKKDSQFNNVMKEIENRFWKNHHETKSLLQEKGLL